MTWTYLNKEFLRREEVKISPFDRGFLFGDGVYEVIPVYEEKAFLLEDHLARLGRSLNSTGIKNPQKWNDIPGIIHELVKKNTFKIKDILRPLLYVPASMTIGVLLTKMQSDRRHLALVIDEYGGVDGLVTIEDLIEQVIGEIEDEHDIDEGQMWTWESDNTIVALARASLDELGPEIGIDFTQVPDIDVEEVDSLGGLVFVLAGRVPVRGEVVQHPQGLEFEIIDADPRRIKRVRLRLRTSVKAAE